MELSCPIVLMLSRLLPTMKNSAPIMTVVNVLIFVSESSYLKKSPVSFEFKEFHII